MLLDKIIGFSIKNKLLIGILTVCLIGFGIYQLTKLPIDAVPDITNNQVQIITVSPSLGAPDVERLITYPIEQAASNIPGKIEIRSFSRFGLSVVTIVFNDQTDVYWARQQVSERLQKIKDQIPKDAGNPELAPVTTGLGEIYQYVVKPKKGFESKYNAQDLRTIQDWIIKKQLIGVEGVADVSSFGGFLKQYEVAVDPNRLKAHNITIQDVFDALERNNQNEGGAYIEKGPTVLYIRSEGLVQNLSDLENIVVKNVKDGTPLLIRDIATIQFGHATRYGAMIYNDEMEVAGAVVMMLKGANSNDVIIAVKERIALISKTLPEGVEIDAFLDRTKMVNNAIGTVSKNLLEGALIVVFILVLFLGNMRAGFLVASVIPLSMLFAVIMMNTFGVSGNLMSLGALDFGLIVDGAVIIVEAVMHAITHSKRIAKTFDHSQHFMDKEVKKAAGKMMNSAVFGQIIILVVYLPIFSLQGIEGKMFKPMAQTVAFALLGAFILSLTYIPMMSALMLKKVSHEPNRADRLMAKLESFYIHKLSWILRFPKYVIGFVLVLFALSVFVLSRMGGEFIPSLEEGDFAVETRVLTGSNLQVSIDVAKQSAKILKKQFPEVEEVVAKIGSSEIPTDPMPIEAQDLMIILKDKKEWTSAESFPELAEKMSTALSVIPGAAFGFQFPVQMRFNELMTGARQDVVCKIFGDNLDTLALYSNLLGEIASKIEGAKDIYVEHVTGMPQIVIKYNRASIAQYQLNISEINNVVHAAFAGKVSGLVFEGEKRFDLVVRMSGNNRKEISDIENLMIATPQGTQVPLYQLAQVVLQEGPSQIQREDAKRRIVIGFNVRGRDVESIVKELQEKIDIDLKLPPSYFITYGGAFENLEAAKQRLLIAVPVSLILIFLFLYFAFNSIRQGLIIYSAIPLSAIGGIFAIALRGMPFSISAGVGFIALFGVAVLNGIVLIAEFNRQKLEGLTDLKQIVLAGTKMRLRPVLMTACVASLGFLPMALSQGSGAEVQRPLATVVIGGLLLATLLTLFVLPVLYILFESKTKHKSNIGKYVGLLFAASLGIISPDVYAQTPIELNAAIDTVLQNNLLLHSEQLKAEYAKKMKRSAWNLNQTILSAELGQYNSIYNDNRMSISQSMLFPTVYARQKSLLNEEWILAEKNTILKKLDLITEVRKVFYEFLFLTEKEKLISGNDSMLLQFVKLAQLRLKTGETNVLEAATAEQQRGQLHIQLMQLQQDKNVLLLRFQLMLGSEHTYIPRANELKFNNYKIDSNAILAHPYLQLLNQHKQVSLFKARLEKSRFLPELTFGYNNTSIIGYGGDNKYYNENSRFQSAQISFGIPVFFGSQYAKSKALKFEIQAAQHNFNYGKQHLESQYKSLLSKFNHQREIVKYYEENGVPNANILIQASLKQYQSGNINYLEWILLLNQGISTKSAYVDAVNNLNQTIIELQAFNNP